MERESKETIRRRLSRRGSILDLVAEDANRVNKKLGSEDRSKLDEYLTAVRQVEQRTQRADEWLNIPKPKVAPSEAERLQRKLTMADVSRVSPIWRWLAVAVSLILWTFALTAAFSFALMLDLALIGLGLCMLVFGAPSVWANWHVVRLAVDAERQPA